MLIVCLVGHAAAQSGAEIKKINFSGNKTFSGKALGKLVKEHHISSFSRIFFGNKPMRYDSATVAEDMRFLARHYQREGFLKVSVAPPRVIYDRKKDAVILNVTVNEGPMTRVGQVGFQIADAPDSVQRHLVSILNGRRSRFELQPDHRFRDSSVVIDQDTLRRLLSYQGYPYANPDYRLTVDTVNWRADVTWRIATGPLAFFDTTGVYGNSRVSRSTITRMVAFSRGQKFNQRLVEKTQRQVYSLGVFEVATVHPNLADPPLPKIPVIITVREMPIARFKTGAGYGREDKFRAFVDARHFGFLGGARQLQLYARHSSLEPYDLRLTFTQPAFLEQLSVLTITPYLLRQSEPAFRLRRYGSEVTLNRTFTRFLTGGLTYAYERVNFIGSNIPESLSVGKAGLDRWTKSSMLLQGQFDDSRPLLDPMHGNYAQTQLTYSGLGFGSTFHFWKMVTELRRYQNFYKRWVLAGRLRVGGIKPLASDKFVPIEERLYAGGSESVRGWARQQLGPKIAGVPTGGNSSIETSVELRFPIYGMFGGALFTDFGNVWTGSFAYHITDLRYSAGFGVRVSTPIGPVRLDLARPVADVEHTWQLQISIGQAF